MGIHMVRVFRILSLSLSRGVPLLKALAASQDIASTAPCARPWSACGSASRKAAGSPRPSRHRLHPAPGPEMLATGERSGHLAKVLERLAEHYQRKLEQRLATLAKIEPVMLLFMGGLVAMIVSADPAHLQAVGGRSLGSDVWNMPPE
jgi:type II secretory pathway component PulF